MREVVTVQVGGFANFVGSHFWNFQVIDSTRLRCLPLAIPAHLLPLRRMSCSGSPTTPAPTRCSGPPRWTWTCCTAPARRTRWRRPPACVGSGQYFTTLLVFPLLTLFGFFRVWPPTAPVWYRSVLEVIDPAVFFLHFASATLLMRNITSSMLFCFLSCKSRADGICRVSWLFEFLRYSGFE